MIVDQNTLAALSGSRFDGNALYLQGQLDRKAYQLVAKVIEAVGGKWNRKAGCHLFDGDASEAVEPVILTGDVTNRKQDLGQFDTPPSVARQAVELAYIEPGMKVYEPSCGLGNIIAAIIAVTDSGANVFGNELDQKRHASCVTRHYNAFGSGGLGLGDFLAITPDPVFDRVVMNPPFAPAQADIHHVLHAFKFLKPGGRLVAIMSAGVTFRMNKLTQEFRSFVHDNGGSIEPLPESSFKESGTMVNTCIVVLQNPKEKT